jgi:hypothetical protein
MLADVQRPRRAVRAFGVNRRAGLRFQRANARRMIPVRMRDENVRDRLAAYGIEQRLRMRGVLRTIATLPRPMM